MSAQKEKDSSQQYLTTSGVLNGPDCARLMHLWEQQSAGITFPDFVVRMGAASERAVYTAMAEYCDLELIESDQYQHVESIADKVSPRFLQSHCAVPCGENEAGVLLAVADPQNEFVAKSVSLACGRAVICKIGLPSDIETAIEKYFGDGRSEIARISDDADLVGDAVDNLQAEKLKDMASEAPVVKLVNLIFSRAHDIRASDIHLEPFEGDLILRYRVDGVLTAAEAPPAALTAAVMSRLKLMARLNIAERRLPQDGRIRLHQNGQDIDVRVSTVPTVHGESIVMRMLNRGDILFAPEDLGFDEEAATAIQEALLRPHGMILVTGPTGSGKTTTLYSALSILNSPEKKVITIEDPVEYQLSGVNQIQVQPAIDLTFASALRAIVRQDPDVIMVGEMRDLETARICVQSALTGHLVLSTVHTNDAAGAITRLLDMGVENYLLPSTLNLVVAQRLVRRLCGRCKTPFTPDAAILEHFSRNGIGDGSKVELWQPTGCADCQHTGYSGRLAIAELLSITEDIRALIMAGADTVAIQQLATSNGMKSMAVDGMRKALAGETSLEEVLRVTRDD